MSDAPESPDRAQPPAAAHHAAQQQAALDEQLREQALERAREHARNRDAVAAEQARIERARMWRSLGLKGTIGQLRREARRQRRLHRHDGVQGLPLAALPVGCGSAVPRWSDAVDVLELRRPAIFADPPAEFAWDVDLPPASFVYGWFALRAGAWAANSGGVELVLELRRLDGSVVAGQVTRINPRSRTDDRQWVPWRWELPASGPHRIVLRTRLAPGAHPDYAWAVIGDPRIGGAWLPQPERAGLSAGQPEVVAPRRPGLTFLLPVHDPEPGLLDRTLASIEAQTDPGWRLCITDDGSRDPAVHERLERFARDPRVALVRHDQAQGISEATNAALALAETDYVATLDHDDVLTPDAVASVRDALAADPAIDVLYSDNDLLGGEGHRFAASLKPDWSPDLLRAVMYTLHLGVYRRALVAAVGGWRPEFDGAQDHDLVLRLTERTNAIVHLPRILYHWRAHAGSAALGELAKPQAYDRGRAAVEGHLKRLGIAGTVERLPQAGRYRVRYERPDPVTVVVLGAADDARLQAIRGRLRDDDALVALPVDERCGVALARFAAGQPAGSTVVVLEGALLPDEGAIDELAGHIAAGAAAAGGAVVSDAGRLLAGALAFPEGQPVPVHPDAVVDDDCHATLTIVTNRAAVRGAVAVRAGTVVEHGTAIAGFDRLALAALTAACSEAGGRVVFSPHATFTAEDAGAEALLRWPLAEAAGLDRGARPDPFWNPQRWPDRGDETIPEAVHENPLIELPDA